MTRYRIIVNPISGRGTGERSIPQVESLLRGYGLDFDLVRTERPWHAAELAEQAAADGCDVVVATGGDGTANEVINGLMRVKVSGGTPPAMGVLSVGRGNDLAHGMGIPPGVEAGCQVLAEGVRRPVDVGRVAGGLYPEGRYFGNCVGIGFDAVVGFEAVKMTWLHGFPSYLVGVLKTVFLYFHAPRVRVEYDGQVMDLLALMVSVMNGQRLGGGFFTAPHGEPDDGLFDLCIARQVSRTRIFGLIPHFLRGTEATQPEIVTGRAKRVVVTALEGTLPAHTDGETLCTDGQRLEMELLPHQIEVITRPKASAPPAGRP